MEKKDKTNFSRDFSFRLFPMVVVNQYENGWESLKCVYMGNQSNGNLHFSSLHLYELCMDEKSYRTTTNKHVWVEWRMLSGRCIKKEHQNFIHSLVYVCCFLLLLFVNEVGGWHEETEVNNKRLPRMRDHFNSMSLFNVNNNRNNYESGQNGWKKDGKKRNFLASKQTNAK